MKLVLEPAGFSGPKHSLSEHHGEKYLPSLVCLHKVYLPKRRMQMTALSTDLNIGAPGNREDILV